MQACDGLVMDFIVKQYVQKGINIFSKNAANKEVTNLMLNIIKMRFAQICRGSCRSAVVVFINSFVNATRSAINEHHMHLKALKREISNDEFINFLRKCIIAATQTIGIECFGNDVVDIDFTTITFNKDALYSEIENVTL
jgi:hypothetical protein